MTTCTTMTSSLAMSCFAWLRLSQANLWQQVMHMTEPQDDLFQIGPEGVRFTPAGLARYTQRFAAAGYDISEIRTLDQLEEALTASWPFEQTRLSDWVAERTSGDPLERSLLLAVTQGEQQKADALMALLKARRAASGG